MSHSAGLKKELKMDSGETISVESFAAFSCRGCAFDSERGCKLSWKEGSQLWSYFGHCDDDENINFKII